jgi:hypothetical protein
MNGQTPLPPPPKNRWEATLDLFRWACRIPVACFLVFTGCCVAFLGLVFLIRATVWIYNTYLAQPFQVP